MKNFMWEILVPTVHYGSGNPIRVRFHRIWDEKVRAITGGLTIMPVAKGQWISPENKLFIERMIPVRVMCSEEQMKQILPMTKKYYNQEAIMYYKISDSVEIYK
jgi:hypothetical protein